MGTINPPTIEISITTTDQYGNVVHNSEKRVFHAKTENPDVESYCSVFFNALTKQEFTNEEVAKGIYDFYIKTDKEELS